MKKARRLVKITAGFAVLIAGIAMLALPGPGWVTIAAGLAILAGEFPWARRLLDKLKGTATQLGRAVGLKDSSPPEATLSDRSNDR